MSASDGYVVGVTKIVDHGPDTARWNLAIIGDGYRASELNDYHTHVENFLATFRTTAPFNELFCGINVYRIDVVSTESGADDPGCGGNPSVTAKTYFDATFCTTFAGSPLERLLSIDTALGLSVVNTYVPNKHQVLCIVNSTKYGGSGGAIATASVHTSASEIAIHEMGHSAFGLADEYGGNGAGTPPGEPTEPNVTRDTNRATNKWRALIAATTPMPSACDSSCTSSTCVPPTTPPTAGAVGTYEGAIYSDCNTYRPLPSCYMRDYSSFCPVCVGVIRSVLQPYQPAETITLVTPSITFANVPAGLGGIGVTTHRAIRWDVVACRMLTFRIAAGPTGGFGLPFGSQVTVGSDPTLPAAAARIWLSYTSTAPGDTASGSVTVECVETGQSWVIPISATTLARPRTAVSLVLDRSGSMNDDAGDGTKKVEKLREAALAFLDVMLPDDGIGLVRFNNTAQRIMEVEDAGPASGGSGRTNASTRIMSSDLDPTGSTSIGDGVVKGRNMLNDAQAASTPDYDATALVVLTDGMWNTSPSLSDVMGSINATTYAIGLGLPSNISVPALTTLCQGNNGFLLVTGPASADQSLRLSKYFLQILAAVTNADIAVDPGGELGFSTPHVIPFLVTEADYGLDAIVLSPNPYGIDFRLQAPDGTVIDPSAGGAGANLQFVSTDQVAYYRCALPVVPSNASGSHAGLWHALLRRRHGDRDLHRTHSAYYDGKGQPYEFLVHTYSSMNLAAWLTQKSYDVGAAAEISAVLREYDALPLGRATVWAEVRAPSAPDFDVVPMTPNRSGAYLARYDLSLHGLYIFRVRARGETLNGRPYERERTLTAVATPGGDRWSPDAPPRDALCELVHCLKRTDVAEGKFAERMKEFGLNIETLLKCLSYNCEKDDREQQAGMADLTQLNLDDVDMDRLADLLARWIRSRPLP